MGGIFVFILAVLAEPGNTSQPKALMLGSLCITFGARHEHRMNIKIMEGLSQENRKYGLEK